MSENYSRIVREKNELHRRYKIIAICGVLIVAITSGALYITRDSPHNVRDFITIWCCLFIIHRVMRATE